MNGFAVEATNLTKSYRDLVAVNKVNFTVSPGEAFGLLGPNGAGKSPIMRMIYCRNPLTSGSLMVNGKDVTRYPREIKARVGCTSENNLDPIWASERICLVYSGTSVSSRCCTERG
jgi:lipooligosaccharide transport system ATP-binding protein